MKPEDVPNALKELKERQRRMEMLNQSHIAPLQKYLSHIKAEHPETSCLISIRVMAACTRKLYSYWKRQDQKPLAPRLSRATTQIQRHGICVICGKKLE